MPLIAIGTIIICNQEKNYNNQQKMDEHYFIKLASFLFNKKQVIDCSKLNSIHRKFNVNDYVYTGCMVQYPKLAIKWQTKMYPT